MNALLVDETLSDGSKIRVARARGERSATVVPFAPEKRRARDSALIYAENRLAPWAKWARENRQTLGYPTISLLYKAMWRTKIGVIRGHAEPRADEHGVVHYPINAEGNETRSFRPAAVDNPPEAIVEVDKIVAALPKDLHEVIVADYFTYGPIEVRCKQTRWRRARFLQLLESAKYAVFIALQKTSTV